MAAVDNIVRYTYTGAIGEVIPQGVTHLTVKDVRYVAPEAFVGRRCRAIVEIICHENVYMIEEGVFSYCPSLVRVIMPGVRVVGEGTFSECEALTDVECGKLEIIREEAFLNCKSLRSINTQSVRIVGKSAFLNCGNITDLRFSNKLEIIEGGAFYGCTSLERIAIPLKDGLITADDIFQGCGNFVHVDLVEGEVHETIAALQLEEWINDMKEEIDSINQILPDADAGYYDEWNNDDDYGQKAQTIRTWIRAVLDKIYQYSIVRYTYTGAIGEVIPQEVTHLTVAKSCTFVREWAFFQHPNIVEVICHENVYKIEEGAFSCCPSLTKVIMPGVEIVGEEAFIECEALTDVECGKLEIIENVAFADCISLGNIILPSIRIVERTAFGGCNALADVRFGSKLERIEEYVFCRCISLERITIPLKDGIIADTDVPEDNIFQGCGNFVHVDLVEGELQESIAALQLEEWRNDMSEEINSINQILLDADAGYHINDDDEDYGEKARVIRRWIRSVLRKIIHYQAEHQHILDEAATALQLSLPQDIVMNNALPFLALLPRTFEIQQHSSQAFLVNNELLEYCSSESISIEGLRELIERHGLTTNQNRIHFHFETDYKFFFEACRNERVTEGVIRYLLDYFPNTASVTGADGDSPLHYACKNKNVARGVIQLLIDAAPASVCSVDKWGRMPLHDLCYNSKVNEAAALPIFKLLIEKHPGAVRHASNFGRLPIHIVAWSKTPEICKSANRSISWI